MENIGGLRQFGKYLGEDYYIGKAMIKAGCVLELLLALALSPGLTTFRAPGAASLFAEFQVPRSFLFVFFGFFWVPLL